ncbi:MAG: hypothetical protein AAFW47_08570 [Pseudomonadota bacterium]
MLYHLSYSGCRFVLVGLVVSSKARKRRFSIGHGLVLPGCAANSQHQLNINHNLGISRLSGLGKHRNRDSGCEFGASAGLVRALLVLVSGVFDGWNFEVKNGHRVFCILERRLLEIDASREDQVDDGTMMRETEVRRKSVIFEFCLL